MSLKKCPYRPVLAKNEEGATVQSNEFSECYENSCPYYDWDNSLIGSKKSYCKKVQLELTMQTKILSENVLNSIAESFK